MSLNTALTSQNYTDLRSGQYAGSTYVSLCQNTIVFSAFVTGLTGNETSYTTLSYNLVQTGAYTDVQVGMTVYFASSTGDDYADMRNAAHIGRVKAITSSTITIAITSDPIANAMVFFVLKDYRLDNRLPREVSGTLYVDTDVSYRNTKPLIEGLNGAYAAYVDADTNVLELTFAPTGRATFSGGAASTWNLDADGGTITAGSATQSSSTPSWTVEFTAGEYWIRFRLTDNNGVQRDLRVYVRAHDTNDPPLLSAGRVELNASDTDGWLGRLTAWDGLADVLEDTLCVVWKDEYYASSQTVIQNNVKLVGRLQKERSSTSAQTLQSRTEDTSYEIVGMARQLADLSVESLAFKEALIPAAWGETTRLTPYWLAWFVLSEFTTLDLIACVEFDTWGYDYRQARDANEASSALDAANAAASALSARLEFGGAGRIYCGTRAAMLDANGKFGLTTVANFTQQDWLSFELEVDTTPKVGQIKAGGAYYNGGDIGYPISMTVVESIAPGITRSEGSQRQDLNNQVLEALLSLTRARAELNERAGFALAEANNLTTLSVQHPAGYNFGQPGRTQFYTWTIAASENTPARAFTTSDKWVLTALSLTFDNGTGAETVQATYLLDTTGAAGRTLIYPPVSPGSNPPAVVPPASFAPGAFNPGLIIGDNPTPGGIPPNYIEPLPENNPNFKAPRDGNTVVAWSASRGMLTKTFRQAAPAWNDIGIDNDTYSILQVQFDRFRDGRAYALVQTTAEDTEGEWTKTFDFTSGVADGWTLDGAVTYIEAPVLSGSGWKYGRSTLTFPWTIWLKRTFAAREITELIITGNHTSGGTLSGVNQWTANLYRNGSLVSTSTVGSAIPGTGTYTRTLTYGSPVEADEIRLESPRYSNFPAAANAFITSVTLEGDGGNPFGGDRVVLRTNDIFAGSVVWNDGDTASGDYKLLAQTATQETLFLYDPVNGRVVYSTDDGDTWSAEIDTGDGVPVGGSGGGQGGFGAVVTGTVTLAAANEKVRKAATFGGAYSDETNGAVAGTHPTVIVIPFRAFGSASVANSSSDPEYLLGTPATVSGETLWYVDSGGKTAITPNASGIMLKPSNADVSTQDARCIAAITSISGTPRLYTTRNTGSTWSNRGDITGAHTVKYRRGDATAKQLFIAADDALYFTNSTSSTVDSGEERQHPFDDTILGLDVYG